MYGVSLGQLLLIQPRPHKKMECVTAYIWYMEGV